MLKDIAIAILAGIAITQRITPPGDPARAAVILLIAVTVFMALLELEYLWDKRQRIIKDLCAVIRWSIIQLRSYPAERAQRHRRRQLMWDHVQRLREMSPEEKGSNLEESEV